MIRIKGLPQKAVVLTVLFAVILSACQPAGGDVETAAPSGSTQTPGPAYTPTPLPPRVLSVCLGETPNTLYPLGVPNAAARSVLAAIYDGPFDLVGYEYQPVILEKMPSLSDGDAQINPLTVGLGDEVVDADGNPILLEAGSRVRPAGCRNDTCVIAFDGTNPISMDRMFVEFKVLPDLLWSDGIPMTADDSVYAFELASNAATPGSKYIFDRTKSYEAADETTIQWWGKPGFVDPTYYTNFWTPLPKRLWEQFSAAELQTTDLASRTPMGYGAYVIKEWNTDTLRLTKNPYYFRSADGLPKFDELIFRIVPDADAAVSAMIEGRCDLIDSTVSLDAQVSLLLEMDRTGQVQSYFGQTPTVEWLSFGINPATYDDGYSTINHADRPDFFGDPRLRQAVAYCLDRQKVVDTVLYGLVPVPDTYISADHPLHSTSLAVYPYDPSKGMNLLDSLGWRDHDNDPTTPRHALGVDRVPQGTELSLTYLTTSATQRRQVSEILAQSLQQCGIGVNLVYLTQVEFYAEGPDGPLFGRTFDLAEYAMSTVTSQPPCARFTIAEIPTASSHWVGTNLSGYKNPTFDSACAAARQSLPDEATYVANYHLTQSLFSQELPAIPLYNRLEIAASRFDFCNFALDSTTSTDLFAIETFDYGDSCLP
jgi:peptide/nickel transport system substrate-binding protein